VVAKGGNDEIGRDPTQKEEMAEPIRMSRMDNSMVVVRTVLSLNWHPEHDHKSEIDQDLGQVMRTCDESKPSTYWEAVDSFSRFSIGRVVVDGDGRAKPRQQAVLPILLILSPKAK
jgi:hypothetical protein